MSQRINPTGNFWIGAEFQPKFQVDHESSSSTAELILGLPFLFCRINIAVDQRHDTTDPRCTQFFSCCLAPKLDRCISMDQDSGGSSTTCREIREIISFICEFFILYHASRRWQWRPCWSVDQRGSRLGWNLSIAQRRASFKTFRLLCRRQTC